MGRLSRSVVHPGKVRWYSPDFVTPIKYFVFSCDLQRFPGAFPFQITFYQPGCERYHVLPARLPTPERIQVTQIPCQSVVAADVRR